MANIRLVYLILYSVVPKSDPIGIVVPPVRV